MHKTILTITSTPTTYFVDGPPTRRANVLNEILVFYVDLDNLPPGKYEYRFVRRGFKVTGKLTSL